MSDLCILNMAENQKKELKEGFLNNIVSTGEITRNKEAEIFKDEGIVLIEQTIPYIENIYRNPNRIIINEEEIVKIELAKKITVESVKHLSKHTNFIKIVNENGEVEPSKILNINKEESYETYENKLIYSLIKNIKIFVLARKEYLEKFIDESNQLKNKKVEYIANAITDGKEMSVNLNINTTFTADGIKTKIEQEKRKIKGIEEKLAILTDFEPYKLFEKKNVMPLMSPIKKTNLILKNVNFQYVMKLWDYLQENLFTEKKTGEVTEKIKKDSLFKKIMDEISLLHFIALDAEDEEQKENKINELKQKLLSNTLEYVELSNKEIEKVLLDKIKKGKLKNTDIEKQIRDIFDKYFTQYLKNI